MKKNSNESNYSINERVEEIRKKLNITKSEFCNIVNISQNAYTNYLKNRRLVSTNVVSDIIQKFNVNPTWLLTGKGEMFLNEDADVTNINIGKGKPIQGRDIHIDNTTIDNREYINSDADPRLVIPEEDNIVYNSADFDIVPLVEAKLSAGGGSFITSSEVINYYAFRKQWLKKERINPKRAVLMRVMGDSMLPLIDEDDIVLVDLNAKEIIDTKIYAIAMDDTIIIKQIRKAPPDKIILHSLNQSYQDITLNPQEAKRLNLIGRIRWLGKIL